MKIFGKYNIFNLCVTTLTQDLLWIDTCWIALSVQISSSSNLNWFLCSDLPTVQLNATIIQNSKIQSYYNPRTGDIYTNYLMPSPGHCAFNLFLCQWHFILEWKNSVSADRALFQKWHFITASRGYLCSLGWNFFWLSTLVTILLIYWLD